MNNIVSPHEKEVLTETQCAARLSVRRETLSHWRRHLGMPFVPLSDGQRPHIRYVWSDVLEWLRARSSGHVARRAPRGRPRNIGRSRNEGGVA